MVENKLFLPMVLGHALCRWLKALWLKNDLLDAFPLPPVTHGKSFIFQILNFVSLGRS